MNSEQVEDIDDLFNGRRHVDRVEGLMARALLNECTSEDLHHINALGGIDNNHSNLLSYGRLHDMGQIDYDQPITLIRDDDMSIEYQQWLTDRLRAPGNNDNDMVHLWDIVDARILQDIPSITWDHQSFGSRQS